MKSTSIHSLNADRGLNFWQKPAYLFLNWVNNLFPYANVDKRVNISFYANQSWGKHWEETYRESSPGRRLSDLFWRTLPWGEIQRELGEIHVLDVGCGQGNYGKRLLAASGGRLVSYTGIDHKRRDNWGRLESEYPQFKFIESGSSDISALIPEKTNLIVTQSAIEHFDEDLKFFEQLKEFIDKKGHPAIQIHNFPAKAILPLYLFHGVRQYTPRTISKITRLFDKEVLFTLFGLGGTAAKKIQFKYFTWPLLVLRKKARWSENLDNYDKEVRHALEHDARHPVASPLFWVLAIEHRLKKPLW